MPRAIVLEKTDGKPGQVYYPLKTISVPAPTPKEDELLVRVSAAALNHRDLFLRQHLYPGIAFDVPVLADGVGTVVGTGSAALDAQWKGKRVILTPSRGWESSSEGPDGPSGQIVILGGTRFHPLGTLQEIVCVEAAEVELAPEHLNVHEAAALPLTGLTAWRAFFTKSGNALPEHNILITGIGGGVALNALQFAVEAGCNVYVTSGSEEKIARAKEMGARAGVNYREEGWENKLMEMLPNQRRWLDAIIDGAGGDIAGKTAKILKVSGTVDVARGKTSWTDDVTSTWLAWVAFRQEESSSAMA
ncbi:hypothetical protein GP486_004240 [Trichoglossum hirsutum]|uniref:Enoyl reductase (ER) domain-containing protein n=1 Tax=Trichoglossum hirsutum TaxID=265104 RepID=A0A9P8RPG1_9PEZI|nr:hypothetical protein GP486_004240 [Trichoglossum hirsutum]